MTTPRWPARAPNDEQMTSPPAAKAAPLAGPAEPISPDQASPVRPSPAEPTHATRRGDIEGLRAVAVVLVVLFHAGIGDFAGGFIGVDVFFVISGFLITGLLLRERQASGTISLSNFYARRARRLLPAALLVLAVTLLVSLFILPPLLLPGLAGDTAAAALYVSNLGFAVQATDYFAAGAAPSPILHFWSLGVEEQFYLCWPLLVLLVARGVGQVQRRVGLTLALIALSSFVFALWLTEVAQPWAFFSLPARAWELALGGLLAIAGARLARLPVSLAAGAGWLGLGLIVAGGLLLNETTPFPGYAALLPTLGAALVLVSGAQLSRWGPARLLDTALPRFLGRISYSLYLWHWPILVLPALASGLPLSLPERLALVGLSVLAAAATYRWAEDPLRRGRLIGVRTRRNLSLAGVLTLSLALLAVGLNFTSAAALRGTSGPDSAAANAAALNNILNAIGSAEPSPSLPSPSAGPSASSPSGSVSPGPGASAGASPSPSLATPVPTLVPTPLRPVTRDGPVPADLQPSLGNARNDYPLAYQDGCHTQTEQPPSDAACLYGDLNSTTTIALFGDSHALSWFPAVAQMATDQGWRLLDLTMSACSPADMPVWNANFNRVSAACANWRKIAVARLVKLHPALILVTGTRGFAVVDAVGHLLSGAARTAAWATGMSRTLAQLRPAAGRVIMIADTPLSTIDPPVCLSAHPTSLLACATPLEAAISAPWVSEEQQLAASAGVDFLDPDPWVCPTSPCPAVIGNLLVYRDSGHLTAVFAAALANRLEAAVIAELARPRPVPVIATGPTPTIGPTP